MYARACVYEKFLVTLRSLLKRDAEDQTKDKGQRTMDKLGV